jgi:hypothetical protein
MAIAQKYPISTPKSSDLIIGTSIPDPNTNDDPKTVNFPVSGISTLIATEIPQGVPGPAGADGADGADGANGTNGTNGTNGVDGQDGAPGANGADGADGQDGAQGPAGADGTSINILGTKPTVADLPATGNTVGDLWVIDQTGGGATAGDGYVWTAGNTWLNIGPLRGPQGIQGTAGTNGTNGTNGTDGAPGATGPAGADGVDGVDGTNGTDGAPGATGSQGPQGVQGLTGNTGAKGDQGEPGVDGADGVMQSVVAGTNVTVDASDPANPIVSANVPFGLTGSGTPGTLAIWTGNTELGNSFLQKGTSQTSIKTSNATATATNSIAFGNNASSTSIGAIAFGDNATAETGTGPIAIGYDSAARADSTVSIGYNSESTGRFSTAIGSDSQAYGLASTAIGRAKVETSADYSVAIGVGSNVPIASGAASIIIGIGGEASGSTSMVFGSFSTATGSHGSKVMAGFNANASGNYAICSGYYTEAHDFGETVFGLYNKVSTGSQTIRPSTPPNNLFIVGNGTSTVNRSNALELNDDGELTLPFYGSNVRQTGFAVSKDTGKIITADAPNYTTGQIVTAASGAGLTLDINSAGITFITWSGVNGDFDLLLPDATITANYYRKFKFVLSGDFSVGGRNVIITPFLSQTINGVSSYTIPTAGYSVVEIWNRGGEWIIIS